MIKQKKEDNIGDFNALLAETSEIRFDSRWKDVRPLIEKDARYRAIDSDIKREDLFQDFVMTLIPVHPSKKLKQK